MSLDYNVLEENVFIPEEEKYTIRRDDVRVKELDETCFSSSNPSSEDSHTCYNYCKSLYMKDIGAKEHLFLNNPEDKGIGVGNVLQPDLNDIKDYDNELVYSQCGDFLKKNFSKLIEDNDSNPKTHDNYIELLEMCQSSEFYDYAYKGSFRSRFYADKPFPYPVDDDGKYPNPRYTDICGCYYPGEWDERWIHAYIDLKGPLSEGQKAQDASEMDDPSHCHQLHTCSVSHDLKYVGPEYQEPCLDINCIQIANFDVGGNIAGGVIDTQQEMNCGNTVESNPTTAEEADAANKVTEERERARAAAAAAATATSDTTEVPGAPATPGSPVEGGSDFFNQLENLWNSIPFEMKIVIVILIGFIFWQSKRR